MEKKFRNSPVGIDNSLYIENSDAFSIKIQNLSRLHNLDYEQTEYIDFLETIIDLTIYTNENLEEEIRLFAIENLKDALEFILHAQSQEIFNSLPDALQEHYESLFDAAMSLKLIKN